STPLRFQSVIPGRKGKAGFGFTLIVSAHVKSAGVFRLGGARIDGETSFRQIPGAAQRHHNAEIAIAFALRRNALRAQSAIAVGAVTRALHNGNFSRGALVESRFDAARIVEREYFLVLRGGDSRRSKDEQ